MERVCENCAMEDDDLVAVRRVLDGRAQPGVELWCFSCRTQYPHEVDDGDQ